MPIKIKPNDCTIMTQDNFSTTIDCFQNKILETKLCSEEEFTNFRNSINDTVYAYDFTFGDKNKLEKKINENFNKIYEKRKLLLKKLREGTKSEQQKKLKNFHETFFGKQNFNFFSVLNNAQKTSKNLKTFLTKNLLIN